MTFKFSGSASAFCQGPQSHVRAVVFSFFFSFFKGICSKPAQKRDNAAKSGGWWWWGWLRRGEGAGGARSKLERST